MRIAEISARGSVKILLILLVGLIPFHVTHSQGWLHADWSFRSPITIPNPAGTDLPEYQCRITLNSSGFNFSGALSDGGDIRVTGSDGVNLIPFFLEEWDYSGQSAVIWIKVPVLPVSGTTVYIYYGNPSPVVDPPVMVETPPAGPYTKSLLNPIAPIGDPNTSDPGRSLIAENIVYDPVTQHYWMIFANYRSGQSVGLVWSDDPTNPDAWNWYDGAVIPNANAPHIIYHDGLWYIFYADRAVPSPYPVAVQSSSSITGPYGNKQTVLVPTEAWEAYRVDEPYVFQRSDGKWIMMYMGDAGSTVEQVGYAEADNILGPYSKFNSDDPMQPDGLCIPFGPAGTFDAGTVADPWVYEYEGTSYIGYTVSPTSSSPWQTALATTTDWQTFTKHGILVGRGTEYNTFRGAVTRIGDQYVFSYTGGEASGVYRMCIATQPVFQDLSPESPVNNPEAVFDFYDGFTGSGLDLTKWTVANGLYSQIAVSNGILSLTGSTTYVRINGAVPFGLNYVGGTSGYIMETRAQHLDQGVVNLIIELGFGAGTDFLQSLRIVDDFPSVTNWQRNAQAGSAVPVIDMNQAADRNWHTFKIYREESPLMAGFRIDETPVETVTSGVPAGSLPVFLMSYGNGNRVNVDWTRVRKWAGSDPVATVGTEEHHTTIWTGLVSNDWNDPGNWTAGVPGTGSVISVPGGTGATLFDGALTIGPLSEMQLEPGGAVTITGDFDNSGIVSIGSTLASSGSLIVNGTASGNITYNRQLLPGVNSAADWHLAAPPVTANSNTNIGKITTVYQWSEPTGTWTIAGITSAVAGRGYNIRQDEASDGVIAFTGPLANGDVTVEASSPYADAVTGDASYFTRLIADGRSFENPGGRGWNLLGNPYPSAINASAFITANYSATPALSQFDPNYVALYLFDGTGRQYYYLANSTGWPSGNELSETHVQAGQGFFVLAMNDNSAFRFTKAMQEHSTATPMLKSGSTDEPWPGLQLKAKHQGGEVVTTVVYNGSMTTGVDPGYDIGLFKSGQEMEIYTSLALKDNGINYTRQALPLSGADTLAVPVGIDYKKGGEVIFSATTVPVEGRRLWLEDRVTGTFTDLSLKSYTVTIPANTYGTGRFFIIASANTPTSVNQPWADAGELRIWASGGRLVIRGVVNTGSLCEIYDINGRKLMEQSLSDGELNTIGLPAGLHGVVVVKVTDGNKMVSRKIVVP